MRFIHVKTQGKAKLAMMPSEGERANIEQILFIA